MEIKKVAREEVFKLNDKYIFHGSSKLFDKARPHQARCQTKNPLNEQIVIYGAKDLRFAIIFAFEKLPKNNSAWAAVNENGKYFAELKGETYVDENSVGYLYCFDKSRFQATKKGSNQFVCYEEVEPELILELKYQDYKDLFVKRQNVLEIERLK